MKGLPELGVILGYTVLIETAVCLIAFSIYKFVDFCCLKRQNRGIKQKNNNIKGGK